VIRIDVHPAGENLTNTPRTLSTSVHVRPAYASCGRSPYMTNFHTDPVELYRFTAPEKKCSRLHLPVRLSCPRDPPQFLSNTVIEAVHLSQTSINNRLLGLPGSYHRHAIGTFNTCSRVPTPRSLIDTGESYYIENLKIATTLSPPFPSKDSTDPLMAPTCLRLFKQHLPIELKGKIRHKSHEWEPPLDFYRNLPSTHNMS
jgi:hypothetical protein